MERVLHICSLGRTFFVKAEVSYLKTPEKEEDLPFPRHEKGNPSSRKESEGPFRPVISFYGGLSMDISRVLPYLMLLFFLYLLARLLVVPSKLLLNLVMQGFLGAMILYGFNFLGAPFGMGIAINPLTALFVGFFKLPGLVFLVLLRIILEGVR